VDGVGEVEGDCVTSTTLSQTAPGSELLGSASCATTPLAKLEHRLDCGCRLSVKAAQCGRSGVLAIAVKDAARPPRQSRSRAPRGLPEPRYRYLADTKLR
jgi:hypothetical protein